MEELLTEDGLDDPYDPVDQEGSWFIMMLIFVIVGPFLSSLVEPFC